jgi:hypothetical protein
MTVHSLDEVVYVVVVGSSSSITPRTDCTVLSLHADWICNDTDPNLQTRTPSSWHHHHELILLLTNCVGHSITGRHHDTAGLIWNTIWLTGHTWNTGQGNERCNWTDGRSFVAIHRWKKLRKCEEKLWRRRGSNSCTYTFGTDQLRQSNFAFKPLGRVRTIFN